MSVGLNGQLNDHRRARDRRSRISRVPGDSVGVVRTGVASAIACQRTTPGFCFARDPRLRRAPPGTRKNNSAARPAASSSPRASHSCFGGGLASSIKRSLPEAASGPSGAAWHWFIRAPTAGEPDGAKVLRRHPGTSLAAASPTLRTGSSARCDHHSAHPRLKQSAQHPHVVAVICGRDYSASKRLRSARRSSRDWSSRSELARGSRNSTLISSASTS